MNTAEIHGTANAGTQTFSFIYITRTDSFPSVESVGVKSLTETSSGKRIVTYQKGFEDSRELRLTEAKNTNRKEDQGERICFQLGLVKEHKFDRLRERIGTQK